MVLAENQKNISVIPSNSLLSEVIKKLTEQNNHLEEKALFWRNQWYLLHKLSILIILICLFIVSYEAIKNLLT